MRIGSFNFFPTVLSASIASLMMSPAMAQSGQGEGAEPGLPTVTIRANRGTIQERFEAPGSRVIVGRDDIEQMGADTVSDVLRQLPGVFATTSADGRTEIRMRGMDRNATQILVDGERTSNGRRGGQLPFDQIPSELIERIEVIRSPTPEFSGATGGTINIVLKQSTIQRETNARLTNQFLNDRNAAQVFFSRTGPVNELTADEQKLPPEQRPIPTTYFFMLSAYERLGGVDRQSTVSEFAANSTEERQDSSRSRTKEAMIIPRFTIKPSLKDTITINPFFIVTQSQNSVEGSVTGFNAGSPFSINSSDLTKTDRNLARISTTWAHRFTGNRLETRLFLERGKENTRRSYNSTTIGSGTPSSALTLDDLRVESVWNLTTKLQGFEDTKVWALGAEIDNRVLTADTVTTVTIAQAGPRAPSSLAYRAEQVQAAIWGQNEWSVFGKSTLVGGIRYEGVSRDTLSGGISYSDDWKRWQPSLNIRTPITPGLQLRAGLAQVTRIPALLDSVGRTVPSVGINSSTRPDVVGNPRLKSETTLSLDVGIEIRLGGESAAPSATGGQGRGGQGRPGGDVPADGQAGVNLFLRDIKDPIVRSTTFDTVNKRWSQRPENGDSGMAWGVETDLKIPLNAVGLAGWNFNGNASLLASKGDLAKGGVGRIPGQPRYLVNMSIAKPIPRAGGFFGGATLSLVGASDLKDSSTSGGKSEALTRLDAYVGQVVAKLGYWRLGINNLNNAGRNRARYDFDSVGNVRTELANERSGRSVFLTVGTRF
jgi:outer membrane receptor for ferrienterochelin and colicins